MTLPMAFVPSRAGLLDGGGDDGADLSSVSGSGRYSARIGGLGPLLVGELRTVAPVERLGGFAALLGFGAENADDVLVA